MLDLDLPSSLKWLFQPARYKVAYGGRGGGKSWSFVRALLFRAWKQKTRILCAREIQNSIKESVHQLLKDQINTLGQEDYFKVKETSISAINGSEFIFEGLRHNVDNIRSKEGIDIAAVFEAKNVSKASWEVLIPTVRQPNSEIWVEFNPELDTDETYKRFVLFPPTNAVVRKVNWSDNPWFPPILKQELDDLKQRDPDAYLNIWEGFCRTTLEGAVYANELREATADGRITRVPYDERAPVHTFWDLGFSDCTSIWFAQKIGFEYQVIDFYQNRLQKLPHYLKMLQDRPYVYGTDYLPHDAEHGSLASDSVAKQMKDSGRKVVTLERIKNIQLGINATRTIFNRLIFDEAKCVDGLQALRHYTYDIDEHEQWSKLPLHNENSHAADALRTLGESIGLPNREKKPVIEIIGAYDKDAMTHQWLGT
jgi:phage terminase large subunit